jgi:hypothetical protein
MDPPDTSSQLELILAKLTALESLPSKVESLEKLLLASNARADSLQQQLTVKDKIICDLQAKTNSLEQYNRGWSIRLNNIPLPDHDQTDTYTVMKTVFDKASSRSLRVPSSEGCSPRCRHSMRSSRLPIYFLPNPMTDPNPS